MTIPAHIVVVFDVIASAVSNMRKLEPICKPELEKYKIGAIYRGIQEWNNLPANTRNIETFDKFNHVQKKMDARYSILTAIDSRNQLNKLLEILQMFYCKMDENNKYIFFFHLLMILCC